MPTTESAGAAWAGPASTARSVSLSHTQVHTHSQLLNVQTSQYYTHANTLSRTCNEHKVTQ